MNAATAGPRWELVAGKCFPRLLAAGTACVCVCVGAALQGLLGGGTLSDTGTGSRRGLAGFPRLITSSVGLRKDPYFPSLKEVQLSAAALCSNPTCLLSEALFGTKPLIFLFFFQLQNLEESGSERRTSPGNGSGAGSEAPETEEAGSGLSG